MIDNKQIPVTASSLPPIEEYINEIKDIWQTRWLTNMGDKHILLESKLASYLGAKCVSLFTNGHLALEAAISALELTGEVITTPFTFASTTHAIVRCGLTPVFCDINDIDYTIDADKIESLITDKTSAIIPVHVYGNICNVEEIAKIAAKHNLRVIYDAAHTFGEKLNDISVANFGDMSMFSFHATKVFNTIEGGALVFNDESYLPIVKGLKNFGITGKETVPYIGGNSKMNEFQAAMGLCNLRHIDNNIRKRKAIAERYFLNLKGIKGIKLNPIQVGVKSNYAYFPVVFDGFKKNRNELYESLLSENIYTRKYFYPLTNMFECYVGKFNADNTPIAKYIADRVLTLPMYPDLSLEDVDRVCDAIVR